MCCRQYRTKDWTVPYHHSSSFPPVLEGSPSPLPLVHVTEHFAIGFVSFNPSEDLFLLCSCGHIFCLFSMISFLSTTFPPVVFLSLKDPHVPKICLSGSPSQPSSLIFTSPVGMQCLAALSCATCLSSVERGVGPGWQQSTPPPHTPKSALSDNVFAYLLSSLFGMNPTFLPPIWW